MISELVLFGKQIFIYRFHRVWILQKPIVFTECRFTLWAFTVCKLKLVKHLRVYIKSDSTGYFRSTLNNFIYTAVK